MGTKMAVQLYSNQWKSIVIIPLSVRFKLNLTRTCFIEVYTAVSGMTNFKLLRLETKLFMYKARPYQS